MLIGLQRCIAYGPSPGPPSQLIRRLRRTGAIAPLAVGAGRGDDDRKLRTSRPGRLWLFTHSAAATGDCLNNASAATACLTAGEAWRRRDIHAMAEGSPPTPKTRSLAPGHRPLARNFQISDLVRDAAVDSRAQSTPG